MEIYQPAPSKLFSIPWVLGSSEDWRNVKVVILPVPESLMEQDRATAFALLSSPSLREDRENAFLFSC